MLEQRLPQSFFAHDTPHVARALLGKLLVHHYNGHLLVGKIVKQKVTALMTQQAMLLSEKLNVTAHFLDQ